MSPKVVAVVVVMLLTLGASCLVVPLRARYFTTGYHGPCDPPDLYGSDQSAVWWGWTSERRVYNESGTADPDVRYLTSHVVGSIELDLGLLFAEQSLILLLGGGLLTWVVRRERRGKAEAAT